MIIGDYTWVLWAIFSFVGAVAVAYAVGIAVWHYRTRTAEQGTSQAPSEKLERKTRAA